MSITTQAFEKESLSSATSFFKISLGEWSFNKLLFSGKMTNIDFPVVAKQHFGISTVEYVNQFFMDKATNTNYLNELLNRCNDNGIKNHLIMCDNEGPLGDPNDIKRLKAVEDHYKWVDAAKHLGCVTIRVNSFGNGSADDVQKAAVDGISRLAEYAAQAGINIIIENHGGYTSDGQWMVSLIETINKPNVGTLPDFGNFCIKREGEDIWEGKCIQEYDRYKGVTEMMPYAKGVSAKAQSFDAKGDCVETDYYRMLKIVKDAGFRGYVGIEYSGDNEEDGVRKTKTLLEKVAARLN
jgi:sugar phosphate isomerase/epimerase